MHSGGLLSDVVVAVDRVDAVDAASAADSVGVGRVAQSVRAPVW